jgi:hypothetical protein
MSAATRPESGRTPGPLAPVAARYVRTATYVFLLGIIWVLWTRAAGLPTLACLVPPILAMGYAPWSVRRFWPAMSLALWMRWFSVNRWAVLTHEPYSAAAARRWLNDHPKPSLTNVFACEILHLREDAEETLESLRPKSPAERWQVAYERASYDLAAGREPDLEAAEAALAEVAADEDRPGATAPARGVYMAYLRAWGATWAGDSGAHVLTDAAKQLDLSSPPARLRRTILWQRYRGTVPFAILLVVLYFI